MAADDKPSRAAKLLIRVATALGASETKMRWRVQRFRNWRETSARRSERRAQHVGYEHKKCPSCRAINDKGEKICGQCGAALSWRITQMVRRAGLGGFATGSALLIAVFVGVFVAVLGTQTGPLELRELIVRTTATWSLADASPLAQLGALVVNPGLIGMLACGLAVFLLGTEIETLYGRFAMVAAFLLTGFIGVVGHNAIWTDAISLGATPGLAGLIGLGLAAGHVQKSHEGRELRNLMVKWAVCVLAILALTAGNIAAEVIALVAGAAMGAVVRPKHLEGRTRQWLVGVAGVAALGYATYEAVSRLAVF